MTLHLLCAMWCPILCPPSGALRNVQKGCIPRTVCTLLSALTYPQWYTSYRWHAKLLKVPGV